MQKCPQLQTPAAKLVRVDLMSPDLINPTAASPIVYFERTAIETNLEASHADMHTPRTKSSSQGGTLLRDNAETESGTKPPAPTMDVDKGPLLGGLMLYSGVVLISTVAMYCVTGHVFEWH